MYIEYYVFVQTRQSIFLHSKDIYGCPALQIKYVVGSESPQSLVDHVETGVSFGIIWQEVLSSKKKVLVMRRRPDLLL